MSEEVVQTEKMDYWAKRWKENSATWHKTEVHPFLIKYFQVFTGHTVNYSVPCTNTTAQEDSEKQYLIKSGKNKIFVPLCGKSKDLSFLWNLGYQVFAVEGVLQPIEAMNEEEKLELQFNEEDSIFETSDGRLKIYFGDLFKCPIERWGPFDFLWDRASLIAVEYSRRPEYKGIIQRSLQNNTGKYHSFCYLLETIEYDKTKFGGPPRSVSNEDMKQIYSDWASTKLLERLPLPETSFIRKIPGMGADTYFAIYLIGPKQSTVKLKS